MPLVASDLILDGNINLRLAYWHVFSARLNYRRLHNQHIKVDGIKGNGKVSWVVGDGKMLRLDMAMWPHSQRLTGYYENTPDELVKTILAQN